MRLPSTLLLLSCALLACTSAISGTQGSALDAAAPLDLGTVFEEDIESPVDRPVDPPMDRLAPDHVDVPSRPPDSYFLDRPPCTGTDCLRAVDLWTSEQAAVIRLADGSFRAWGVLHEFGLAHQRFSVVPVLEGESELLDFEFTGFGPMVQTLDRTGVLRQGNAVEGYRPVPMTRVNPVDFAYSGLCTFIRFRDGQVEARCRDPRGDFTIDLPPDTTTLPRSSHHCVGGPSGITCVSVELNAGHRSISLRRAAIPGAPFLEVLALGGHPGSPCAVFRRNLQVDTEVWCWNGAEVWYGGPADTHVSRAPVPIDELDGARSVAVGGSAFAVMGDGTVRARGNNRYGNLGLGTSSDWSDWVTIPGLRDVVLVSGSSYGACALTRGGEVWCWGMGHSPLLSPLHLADDAIAPPTRITWQ
ncbi:MAG: hypothetical protein R3A48_05440 [Polyangiales bacterium]